MSQWKKNTKNTSRNHRKNTMISADEDFTREIPDGKETLIYETPQDEMRHRKKKKTNRQILHITYFFVLVFLGLVAYMIKFTYFDAATIVTDSHNKRQSAFSESVTRGTIYSADGEILAKTEEDSDGNQTREYPYGKKFAHVVGYCSKGKAGLESKYNLKLLTSSTNIMNQISNSLLGLKNEGDDLYTTLDTRLQEAAYDALDGKKGAVIAIEPDTGKVLAMVSKPDYNPNTVVEKWESLNSSKSSKLLNRATQGLYPPGSTFKIVTALEYMRENSDYDNFSYQCEGTTIKYGVKVSCYQGSVHGTVNLTKALAKSCNTAFVNLGSGLNKSKFRELADSLLLNDTTGIDISSKQSKFTITSKSENSDMPQTVIGQGDTLMTPLNNAMIMCAIANDGVIMKPHLADKIVNADGGVVKEYESKKLTEALSSSEANTMKEMLKEVVDSGTASALSGEDFEVAGKTGSAEYNSKKDSHAWFVGMAGKNSLDDPDIVVCVLVEGGGSGSKTAVPVAKEVLEQYYDYGMNNVN